MEKSRRAEPAGSVRIAAGAQLVPNVVWHCILACAVVLGAFLAWATDGGRVESIGPLTDTRASEGIRKILEPKGYRVRQPDGQTLCELWVRENVPSKAGNGAQGAMFPELDESVLIGAISVGGPFTDYKGQSIKPGLYTMRYALVPEDVNHLGIAPSRDFVLLVPITADTDPNATFSATELVSLSRQASVTNHPAPLNLVQPEGNTLPNIIRDFEGHVILAVKLKMQNHDLSIGLVVEGQAILEPNTS